MGVYSICFVSPDGYPLLNPACVRPHGGAEVQMYLLARSFAERDYDVHMVTLDHGQPDGEMIDGVRVWRAYARNSGIPVARFLHPRATGLLRALSRAGADVYLQSCAGMATGLTAWFCRRRGSAFVYRVAHDTDCMPERQLIQYARDRKLYEYGLRQADAVVAQSRNQKQMLADNYRLGSEVGGSLVESWPGNPDFSERGLDVLWVGSIRWVKRPDIAVMLGKRLPDRRVRIVGGPVTKDAQLFEELERESATAGNVEWMGFQPYHDTRAMFARARVFLSTSESEGFPNTYLQAWMAGTPVVAFFDPDGLIAREKLGVVVHSFEEAVEVVDKLLSNPDWWQQYSNRAREYAIQNHGSAVVDRYESLVAPLFSRQVA